MPPRRTWCLVRIEGRDGLQATIGTTDPAKPARVGAREGLLGAARLALRAVAASGDVLRRDSRRGSSNPSCRVRGFEWASLGGRNIRTSEACQVWRRERDYSALRASPCGPSPQAATCFAATPVAARRTRLVEFEGSNGLRLVAGTSEPAKPARYGGERGIRTLDGRLTHTPLAGERLQPLGHLSVGCMLTGRSRRRVTVESVCAAWRRALYRDQELPSTWYASSVSSALIRS